MVIKGNALIRIPWDNLKLQMPLKDYMTNVASIDQQWSENVMTDYNKDKKDIVKF